MRLIVLALSLCFIVLLVCVGGAELVFQKGKAEQNAALLKTAQRLNPLASDYAYEEYRVTGDLETLRRAMRLEPTRPAYHMYYGIALLKAKPRTRPGDLEAVAEICKASRLKPYSRVYALACDQFKAAIGG